MLNKAVSQDDLDEVMNRSWEAFVIYRRKSLKERAAFLHAIARELENSGDVFIALAQTETNLPEARLRVELKRTIFQLNSYAVTCEEGSWLDIRIDVPTATEGGMQPTVKTDLRKTQVPLGPVIIFGASNFPFAYSTAGGDTACALAAGCSVVVKAHPAHAGTSEKVAEAVQRAALSCSMPEFVFQHVQGASVETGTGLVQHPLTKAVGFTGSFEGGKALFDIANKRPVPIPVFAEMGSVNPVFLLPGKLAEDPLSVARQYAVSITQSSGQFCTNPGLLIGIIGEPLNMFKNELAKEIRKIKPEPMLHSGIAYSFHRKREIALSEFDVDLLAETGYEAGELHGIPTLAEVPAGVFLKNSLLHKEIFGPFSLLVSCHNPSEMLEVAKALEGQLTATLIATADEVRSNQDLIEAMKDICGRFILNGVPTGVEVSLAMQHGGPFPATTDSRFTAVGGDGIRRFTRPICYQNWSNELLPEELRDENLPGLWRTVNNIKTRGDIK